MKRFSFHFSVAVDSKFDELINVKQNIWNAIPAGFWQRFGHDFLLNDFQILWLFLFDEDRSGTLVLYVVRYIRLQELRVRENIPTHVYPHIEHTKNQLVVGEAIKH